MQPELIGGRYRVTTAIGRGGMGTVWLCRDETLHREVAVKQVGLPPGESVTDSARALREARSSAALSHRNVVTVFDVVEEEGQIWLVMEHVPGRSLAQIIREDGPLDPRTVADIGAQVASGLAAAHAAGTMHRDVKPGNVLVREDGTAKISDFGIARTAGDATLTQSGFLTGTPSYFSPELARGADPGPGTDVWALGATLYAAVEGRPAYEQRTNPVAVLHDIASGPPAPPQRAGVLEPALLRMMDRDPQARWSMQQAADELGRLAAEGTEGQPAEDTTEDVPTRPVIAPTPTGASAARPAAQPVRRRTPRLLALVVALLVLVAGGAYVAARLGETPPSAAPGTGGTDQTGPEQAGGGDGSAEDGTADEGSAGDGQGAQDEEPSDDAEAMEQFVRDYYAIAPEGSDEAWEMLGPTLREQGRASYDRFWGTIESVEVTSARARPDDGVVDVTLRYRTTDGRVSTERKREGLVPDGEGGYLLDTDVPAG